MLAEVRRHIANSDLSIRIAAIGVTKRGALGEPRTDLVPPPFPGLLLFLKSGVGCKIENKDKIGNRFRKIGFDLQRLLERRQRLGRPVHLI